jgi:hypothetical protein
VSDQNPTFHLTNSAVGYFVLLIIILGRFIIWRALRDADT